LRIRREQNIFAAVVAAAAQQNKIIVVPQPTLGVCQAAISFSLYFALMPDCLPACPLLVLVVMGEILPLDTKLMMENIGQAAAE
jgi:hypothetical protein